MKIHNRDVKIHITVMYFEKKYISTDMYFSSKYISTRKRETRSVDLFRVLLVFWICFYISTDVKIHIKSRFPRGGIDAVLHEKITVGGLQCVGELPHLGGRE